MACSPASKAKKILRLKTKAFPVKEKVYCFILQAKADHQRSNIPFGDRRWIASCLIEKELPNNNYLEGKLKTNRTQILHRIHVRKYNPEKPMKTAIRKRNGWLTIVSSYRKPNYTPLHAKQIAKHGTPFFIPITNTDSNAGQFEESHIQEPDTGIVPCSNFLEPSHGPNQETCATSDPPIVDPSTPKSNGQCQDLETATDLRHNDNSKQTSESNTDFETAYEPMQHPPTRENDCLSTIEINDLNTENIPQNEPGNSRGCNYKWRPNPNSNYSEIYRYLCVQEFIPAPFMCHLYPLFFLTLLFLLSAHTSLSVFFFGSKSIPKQKTSTTKIEHKTFSCKLN